MPASSLLQRAGHTAGRSITQCRFCCPRVPANFNPLRIPVSSFSTTAPALARKSRPSTIRRVETEDGAKTRVPDKLADEFAEQILDDFFGPTESSRRVAKLSRESVESEADGGWVDQNPKPIASKKPRIPNDERKGPREQPMPVLPPHHGADSLHHDKYAEHGIESAEAREKRHSVAQIYHDSQQSSPEAASTVSDDWYVDQSYNLPEDFPNKEDLIPRWMRGIAVAEKRSQGIDLESEPVDVTGPVRLSEIVNVLKDEKGSNLAVISMRDKCDYTDFMIVVEGRSKKQIYSMADAVRRKFKHRTQLDASLPSTLTIEGADSDDWMVLDLGRFMVHCFTPEARAQYNLEGLWTAIKDPLLALARDTDLDVTDGDAKQQLLDEAGRGWDTRPTEQYRIKDIERKHVMAEEEVLEKFNSAQ